MKKRIGLITLVVGALAISGVVLIRNKTSGDSEPAQAGKQEMPPAVRVVSAVKAPISSGLELTGSVEPYRAAELASPAEGPVLDVRVREGDLVRSGDTLLAIGRTQGIDALITSLREALKKEEDNLGRKRRLVESGVLPVEDLDQARAAYEKARAQLVDAEQTARDFVVTAPWTGVVSQVIVKEGQFVVPRAALLHMYDPGGLVIRAAVPERYAAGIAAGMLVDLRLDAFPDSTLKARIERVYPYLDPSLRTRTVEIVPDVPLDLLPGMFARLRVLLETVNDAVVVPAEAVLSTLDGKAVFVVEAGKALRRQVKTGIEEGDRIQIVAGVGAGERVVVAGNERLRDGMAVSVAGGEEQGADKSRHKNESPARPEGEAGGDRP